jgi:hypothetical protein
MRRILPFSLFENVNSVPSHEELIQLPEFKRMKWCNPRWTTKQRAYSNGTRKISFQFESLPIKDDRWGIKGFQLEYSIYPHKGVISDDRHSVIRGLKFNTMDEWNESLLHMNAYLIAHALSKLVGGNRTIFVKAIKGNRIKDPETLIQILESPRIPADFLEIIFQIFDLSDLVERIEEIDTKHIIKIFHSLPLDKQEGVKRKLEISTDDVQSLSNLGEIGFFD